MENDIEEKKTEIASNRTIIGCSLPVLALIAWMWWGTVEYFLVVFFGEVVNVEIVEDVRYKTKGVDDVVVEYEGERHTMDFVERGLKKGDKTEARYLRMTETMFHISEDWTSGNFWMFVIGFVFSTLWLVMAVVFIIDELFFEKG